MCSFLCVSSLFAICFNAISRLPARLEAEHPSNFQQTVSRISESTIRPMSIKSDRSASINGNRRDRPSGRVKPVSSLSKGRTALCIPYEDSTINPRYQDVFEDRALLENPNAPKDLIEHVVNFSDLPDDCGYILTVASEGIVSDSTPSVHEQIRVIGLLLTLFILIIVAGVMAILLKGY